MRRGSNHNASGRRNRQPPEWRGGAACHHHDPDLFFPEGTAGPALRQVDRTVSKDGAVHLAGSYVLAAEILGGRRVSIRIEGNTMMIFDPGPGNCCAPGPAR
jgi:hypothetical protein